MLVLTIKTDQPNAEIGLYEGNNKLQLINWEAGRALAETLNSRIEELLKLESKNIKDLQGIVCFKGPGSFTGLRIGLTVGNAMAYGLAIPIVGTGGDNWASQGLAKIESGDNDIQALPEYGAPVHITPQKK